MGYFEHALQRNRIFPDLAEKSQQEFSNILYGTYLRVPSRDFKVFGLFWKQRSRSTTSDIFWGYRTTSLWDKFTIMMNHSDISGCVISICSRYSWSFRSQTLLYKHWLSMEKIPTQNGRDPHQRLALTPKMRLPVSVLKNKTLVSFWWNACKHPESLGASYSLSLSPSLCLILISVPVRDKSRLKLSHSQKVDHLL